MHYEHSAVRVWEGYMVTVVTVSLNAIDTIRDTLESVASQNKAYGIEHLCIDGGSADGTRQCIQAHEQEHPNVRYIFEPDAGLFDAMNKGIQHARGQYVMFLNADDFLASPNAIADVFSDIPSGDSPDILVGRVIMGRLDRFGLYRMRFTPSWLTRYPHSGAHPPHQATFVKLALLRAVGGFNSVVRAASDTDTFYKLVRMTPRPTMQITSTIVSFMRAGGESNAGLKEYRRGNFETYRLLCTMEPRVIAALSVVVKMLQKVFEFRLGILRSHKWYWWQSPATAR